jgi:outer membrane immunogenic protein
MKKFLIGAAVAGLGVTSLGATGAQAADLAARPYTKAPAMVTTVYDWTGFYVGVNAGVGIGRDRTIHDLAGAPSPSSLYLSPQGGLGGGQIGYNWQTGSLLGPLVYGVEADIQGAGLSDNRTNLPPIAYTSSSDWFGTVRGRLGLATGPVLSYVTGGYAYGNVKSSILEAGVTAFSTNRTQGGWVIGSGVEAALGGNWTGKIEYLYLNLGNNTDAFTALATPQTVSTEVREHIFRVGLNYRINGNNNNYTPMAAANWTGWYLGGNFGSGTGRDQSSLVAPALPLTEVFNLAPDGVNGGVQAGYNWQAANWVYGIEADIQGSTQQDNKTGPAFGALLYDARLPWFGTVRGRLGYSVGSTLFYATGGYAYGSVKTQVSLPAVPSVTNLSGTKGGWTAGAGIETPFQLFGLFGPNWTSKTEYLYVDLGSSTDTFSVPLLPPVSVAFTSSTRVTEHIFRTGLNYHFNSPVVAKY